MKRFILAAALYALVATSNAATSPVAPADAHADAAASGPAIAPAETASNTMTPVVTDDTGHRLRLLAPAKRIVSLAPHATELLFAAGAGARVVGVSQYSDFPPQAARIASVGGAASLDIEGIAALKPDLVVAWASGTSSAQLQQLRALGITIFESEPRSFEAVASSLERLAQLTGTEATADAAALRLRADLAVLRTTYAARAPVSVFFQIWQAPLITVNDAHLVSSALQVCGARNVFGTLPQLAPTVSLEAVLHADPDAIVTSGNEQGGALDRWKRFPTMRAVALGNLLTVPGETMTRAGPRIVEATRVLCEKIDGARQRLAR